MAGIFGNSAEDRHFERQLDEYLDGLETVEDMYGDEADKIIENDYKESDGDYYAWLVDNCYMPDAELEQSTLDAIKALVMTDKRAKDAYRDAVYHDLCVDLYEKYHPERERDYDDDPDYDRGDFDY